MSKPSTRSSLLDYCKRALGHPVIDINVDDDQIEDRLDDALQFFSEYHFDGMERVYIKYIVTETDIANGYIDLTYSGANTNRFNTAPGTVGENADQQTVTEVGSPDTAVKIEDTIISVIQVFHFTIQTMNMFDVRYQYALNDLYTFGSIDLINYTTTQSYLSLLRQMLSPEKSIRFSRKTNKLYIDMKWNRETHAGDYIIIEAWRALDARVYPEIYNDMLLKKYLTQLIKRQWGANLSKYKGVQLIGGVTMDGDKIYTQAQEEIEKIESTVQSRWEEPPGMIWG